MAGTTWPALVAGNKARASEVEAKFDWIEGDIVPMSGGTKANNTYDLGTAFFGWRDIQFKRQAIGPVGSAGTPSYAFSGQLTDGMFAQAVNVVGITTNSVERLRIKNGGVEVRSGDLTVPSAGRIYVDGGSDTYIIGSISPAAFTVVVDGATALDIDAGGRVTKPGTSCFTAYNSAQDTTVTGDATVATVDFDTEVFDVDSNFSADTFTAPVTGKYLLIAHVKIADSNFAAKSTSDIRLATSNQTYQELCGAANSANYTLQIAVIADMDAADTAIVQVRVQGGAKDVAIDADAVGHQTFFSGELIS